MSPRPYEIYQAEVRFRHSTYPRPVVVLEQPCEGEVAVALLSGQMDSYDVNLHFKIDASDPDFAATGLNKTCYVAGDEVARVQVARLLRKRGELTGELLAAFKRWVF